MPNVPEKRESTIPAWIQTQSSGGYSRHLKWVKTSGFETYISTILVSSKTKKKKGKKWYELTPRYQRARPKYGQSALHLSSGRENKQALSGVHETLHPIGIALFGLTAWGSNPQKGLRLKYFFFTMLYMVPFDFCAPNCPLAVKCLSLEHDPPAEKEKTYE